MSSAKLEQVPRLHASAVGEEGHAEHKVTWLELFYDLVYVTTLINLGHAFSADVSLSGVVRFVLLFIPIWWSWTGVTFYVNRFTSDEIWHRILIFIQIFAIIVLGVSVDGAWGDLGIQFTLAYVAIRLVLVILYFRAARYVEDARELGIRYGTGFLIAAVVWLLAVFVPQPYRPYVWLLGMLVDFLVPLSPRSQALNRQLPINVPHLAERYGLFTIIVLGESFVKFQVGTLLNLPLVTFGILAVAITCLCWWIYFDDVANAKIQPTSRAAYVWIYSHLPIAVSLIAFGIGAYKLLSEIDESHVHLEYLWLTSGALIVFLIFIGLIDAVTVREQDFMASRVRSSIRFGGALLLLLLTLFGTDLTSTQFIGVAAVIFVIQIAVVVVAGMRRTSGGEPSAAS